MKDIDFTIDETDPEVLQASGNFSPLKAHRLLQRYLESSSDPDSLTRAAAEIHSMLCVHDGLAGEEKKVALEHNMFMHTLLDLVGKIPYFHRAQDDIVRLLVLLRSPTKLSDVMGEKHLHGWQFYANLSFDFIIEGRCFENVFWPSTFEEKEMLNRFGFLGRLSAAHMLRDANIPVMALSRTLEYWTDSELDGRYSGFIAAASMLIIHAGQWIFTEIVKSPRTISDKLDWRKGPLYTGSLLGLERWKFWRKVLEAACVKVEVSSESQALAEKAIDFMDAIESVHA